MSTAELDEPAGGDPETEIQTVVDDTEEGAGDPVVGENDEAEEDADAEGEGETGEEGEGDGEPPLAADAPASRGSKRIQALANENAELKKRLDEVIAEVRRTPPAAPDPAAERAEAEKLAAMDPVERALYEIKKENAQLRNQVNGLGHHISDATDKAAFEAKASINPVYKKYADRVEKALATMRKNNANTTREALLTYMIGEDARKRLESKSGSETRRRAAATRVENTKGRPVSTRSDVGGSRSDPNSLQSLEKRLAGQQI